MAKCLSCKKEIQTGEQCYQLRFGSFEKSEMHGIGFEEAESVPVHGYVHFKCGVMLECQLMNSKKWDESNRLLIDSMECFYRNYQKQNAEEFKKDWVNANKKMCAIAAKKFRTDIIKQIEHLM